MTSRVRYALFVGRRIILTANGRLPRELPDGVDTPPLGPLDARHPLPGHDPVHVLEWPEDRELPDGLVDHPLRAAFSILGDDLAAASRAAHLLEWRRTHRFCGRCGARTELLAATTAVTCPECGLSAFPRLAPAIIVLVHDGDRAILGRSRRYPPGMYSTLAGFVEPGETLEETVHREVREETGVEVDGIEYLGSQHWPFPHSLMVGFHARWVSGEPRPCDDELDDVRWFRRDELPAIPPRQSIAHRLIHRWVEESGAVGRSGGS